MSSPTSESGPSPAEKLGADDPAAKEIRLCFGAALGCFIAGLLGWTLKRFTALDTSLSALLLVGLFFGALGLTRLIYRRRRARDE